VQGTERFFAYARARYELMLTKELDLALTDGAGAPWTDDPILAAYRFCNVFREDDRVTRWFRDTIREPLGQDGPRQLLAAVVFRWFNKIETGELLKPLLLGTWNTEEARRLLKDRVASGHTILGAAYMIKSPPGMDKVDGLLSCIDPIAQEAEHLAWHIDPGETELQGVHDCLKEYPYLGAFMAYEIVTDLRHTFLLDQAPDIMTWASAGPGAARGLCRVQGLPLGTLRYQGPRDQQTLIAGMRCLLAQSQDPAFWPVDWPRWEMRDVEHTLCEFDKYERARLGEGAPKQRYQPRKG